MTKKQFEIKLFGILLAFRRCVPIIKEMPIVLYNVKCMRVNPKAEKNSLDPIRGQKALVQLVREVPWHSFVILCS